MSQKGQETQEDFGGWNFRTTSGNGEGRNVNGRYEIEGDRWGKLCGLLGRRVKNCMD